jgi:hypothetical protein
MDRLEWDTNPNVDLMCRFAGKTGGEIPLRQFSLACVERVRGLVTDGAAQEALGALELLADGKVVGPADLATAVECARNAALFAALAQATSHEIAPACAAAAATALYVASGHPYRLAARGLLTEENVDEEILQSERSTQARILRRLFNPFAEVEGDATDIDEVKKAS